MTHPRRCRDRAPRCGWIRLLRLAAGAAAVGVLLLVASPAPAGAAVFDCKESPTPDMPGTGLAGFFAPTPEVLPAAEDPFAEGASTSVYEQYGLAGLRWNTYDLGCGPDAARNPDAVVGTAVANWVMNLPLCLASVTSSITEAAFAPSFLDVFDPLLGRVSTALHEGLFANWAPVVIAAVGIGLLIRARGLALASTAGAVGWAVLVVLLTTAVFRWPVETGRMADETVTGSLAAVVDKLNGGHSGDPGTAVAGGVQASILYTAWLSGELGSTTSRTAETYGPRLFRAQTLTWREARLVQSDPKAGKDLIEQKRDDFEQIADQIKDDDPAAYEHLTGKRSDTRVGYALLAALATVLALPFLLIAALMLLGSFLVIRLAVMVFPLIATLGLFPAGRGLVVGVGRTVGAALVNAVVFGAGAAVTVVVFGVILDPGTGLAAWLILVLLPVFSLVMWALLKPFRRLTSMASRPQQAFGDAATLGHAGPKLGHAARGAVGTAVGFASAGVTGAATSAWAAAKGRHTKTGQAGDQAGEAPVERMEAHQIHDLIPALTASTTTPAGDPSPAPMPAATAAAPTTGASTYQRGSDRGGGWRRYRQATRTATATAGADPSHGVTATGQTAESRTLPVIEPQRVNGEDIYPIYRPDPRRGDPHGFDGAFNGDAVDEDADPAVRPA